MRSVRTFSALFVMILSAWLCFTGYAEEQTDLSVKAQVNRAVITIGDPVEYSVTIRHAPSVQILSTIPPPPSDLFKIKKVQDIQEEDPPYQITGKKYTLTTFRLGEFVLEPVEIQYRKDGGEVQSLQTEKIYITVKSVAEGEIKEDIRGVKSVLSLISGWGSWLLWLILGLGLLLAFLVYKRLTKRQETPIPAGPVLTAEEDALLRLSQLFDSDLLRRAKIKEYYLKLSEILRTYLERRFHILAVEQTTTEIANSLKRKDVDRVLRDKINAVLEAADLAKFAKWKPEPAEIIHLNQESKQIVEMAKPKEPMIREKV